jgi:uncharacterized protein YdgA (DUF945 family)
MKKSLVAISIIAVLGAAWSGASWYTGKLIEQRMDDVVNNANDQLKKYWPDAGIKLSYENYQRGVFSSQIRFVLRASANGAVLGQDDEVALLETIDHGPFPLIQLKQFNLLPCMASVHSELERTPASYVFFFITNGKSPIVADTRVAYNGDASTALDIPSMDYQHDEFLLKFSGLRLNLDISHDLKTGKLDLTHESTVATGPDNVKFTLQGLMLKGEIHGGRFYTALGNQALGLKRLQFVTDGREETQMDNLTLTNQLDEAGSNLSQKLSYSVDNLKIKGHDLGGGKLVVNIDNLDAKATQTFIDRLNQQTASTLRHTSENDGLRFVEIFEQTLPPLLKANPTIHIAPLSWKNNKGEGILTFNLDLKNPEHDGTTAVSLAQKLSKWVKRLEAHLTVPLPMATEASAQIMQLNGASTQEAQTLAPQQLQNIIELGQRFKLVTLKDNVIGSDFRYVDQQVELNGQQMSLEAFITSLTSTGAAEESGVPATEDTAPEPEQPAQCH